MNRQEINRINNIPSGCLQSKQDTNYVYFQDKHNSFTCLRHYCSLGIGNPVYSPNLGYTDQCSICSLGLRYPIYSTNHGTIGDKNHCSIEYAKDKKIFFKSLKKTSKKETIERVFSQFGRLKYLRVPFSKQRQRNLGYGYAIFETQEVRDFLLQNVKEIQIDGKTVYFQSFMEHNQKSKNKIKELKSILDQKKLEDRHDMFSITSKFKLAQGGSKHLAESKTLFHARWDLHSIKPSHSLYSKLRNSDVMDHGVTNLQVRIKINRQ